MAVTAMLSRTPGHEATEATRRGDEATSPTAASPPRKGATPPVRPSDRWITRTTAAAVLCVAGVAAVVSYEHAYALVRQYGEQGWTARLVPLTVDGLIFASSMVMLHCARRHIRVPALARWLLGLGITATLAANATHGLAYGAIGALIAAWPAVALVGCYELLMLIIRYTTHPANTPAPNERPAVPDNQNPGPPSTTSEPHHEPDAGSVPELDPLQKRARDQFRTELANGTVPSIRTIRSHLRIGQPKAQDLQTYLAHLTASQPESDGTPATTKTRPNDPG